MEPKRLDDFLKWEPAHPPSIISKGILYESNKAILYGKYKSLKTMLCLNLAEAISKGEPWLGLETCPKPVNVLYVQLEISEALLHVRMKKMQQGREVSERLWLVTEHFLKLDDINGVANLRETMLKIKPKLLIIDPFYKVLSGDVSQQKDVMKLLDYIDAIIAEFKCAVILVAHARKGKYEGSDSDDLLGSTLLSGWPDSLIKIEREGENSSKLRVLFEVIRHAEEEIRPIDLFFSRVDISFHAVPSKVLQIKKSS